MATPRSAFCLFCDDIRLEVGNKPSFMGVYTGEMVFPADSPPGLQIVIPKFGILVWLFCDKDDAPSRITLHLYGPPGKTEIIKFDVPLGQTDHPSMPFQDVTRLVFHAALPIVGLPISYDGVLEVTLETERETVRAGRLRLRMPSRPDPTLPSPNSLTPSPPTASPQPSEQSPPDVPVSKRRRGPSRRATRPPEPE